MGLPFSCQPTLPLRLAARVHQGVLSIYPTQFRREFGSEMQAFFEARCCEVYGRAGIGGVGQWLLLTLFDGLSSAYQEHVDAMTETFGSRQEARSALILGTVFLSGTWAALFFLAGGLLWPRQLPGGVFVSAGWVVVNTLLVGRALVNSERFENLPGMAALVNVILIASLMAAAGMGQRLAESGQIVQSLTGLLTLGLVAAHARLLWQLRGEALTATIYKG